MSMLKILCLFILIWISVYTFSSFTYPFGKNKNFQSNPKCYAPYIPADSAVMIIWYNRVACRACFDELNIYIRENLLDWKYKIYVGVYEQNISPQRKREIMNTIGKELLPDCEVKIFFMTEEECPDAFTHPDLYTPSVSIVVPGEEVQFYSYDKLFKSKKLSIR